uniref:Uncharacterized protein n=1 Tax=Micrurus corallinus TaxID=54390 RepID=A0A2D4EY97_MICCO
MLYRGSCSTLLAQQERNFRKKTQCIRKHKISVTITSTVGLASSEVTPDINLYCSVHIWCTTCITTFLSMSSAVLFPLGSMYSVTVTFVQSLTKTFLETG